MSGRNVTDILGLTRLAAALCGRQLDCFFRLVHYNNGNSFAFFPIPYRWGNFNPGAFLSGHGFWTGDTSLQPRAACRTSDMFASAQRLWLLITPLSAASLPFLIKAGVSLESCGSVGDAARSPHCSPF